jgi:hypothetical protein
MKRRLRSIGFRRPLLPSISACEDRVVLSDSAETSRSVRGKETSLCFTAPMPRRLWLAPSGPHLSGVREVLRTAGMKRRGPQHVTPSGYATLVATDAEKASIFDGLLRLDERDEAGVLLCTEAIQILTYCKGMTSDRARNLEYLSSLKNIEKVGKRSARRGDRTQAQWCDHLHWKLKGN